MFEKRKASFDLTDLIGRAVADAQQRCEADGFDVQVLDLEKHPALTLEFRPNRVRLMTRHGKVEEVLQG
jgi:hypothetical protein